VYSAPGDGLSHRVAALVTVPTEAREWLCQGIYWKLEPGNPLGLLQEAMLLAGQLETLVKRIRVEGVKTGKVTALDLPGQIQQALAAGIVSETEAAALREYDRKTMELINVDDFASEDLGTQARPLESQATAGQSRPYVA
jgi:acyl-CoA dehydrogenase